MANDTTPVWFITGCSTGFGNEIAKAILQRGWRVVATARNPDSLKELAAGNEANLLALPLDLEKADQISDAVAKALHHFGRIDVLVNNAGYGYLAAIEEGEDEAVRKLFEANFFGLVDLTKAVLPGMRMQGSGNVVNLSSIGGLTSFAATGYYHAAKYAVEGLSESLALEVGPLGIKVTIVEPGPFRTDWAGRSLLESKTVIPDYDKTAGERRRQSKERSGKQQGDPARGAEAIIKAVTSDNPPLHLLLGKPAIGLAEKKLQALQKDIDTWKDVTLSADFPEFQDTK